MRVWDGERGLEGELLTHVNCKLFCTVFCGLKRFGVITVFIYTLLRSGRSEGEGVVEVQGSSIQRHAST